MRIARKIAITALFVGCALLTGWMIDQINPGYTEYERVMP